MQAIAVLLYVIYFPLTWFENIMVVRDVDGSRPIWFHGDNQVTFQIITRLIALVSVGLIGWQFSFIPALIAFIGAIVFSRVTFSCFYKKSLERNTASILYRVMVEEDSYNDKHPREVSRDFNINNISPRNVSKEAMRIARDSIHSSNRGDY
jgi:hypothetical protein